MTTINENYEFNCILCNKGVDFEELEKGGTFTAYKLKCASCSHNGYMFAVFVPTGDDLKTLIDRYKSIMTELGTEEK